jgi:hypothetical protein
VPLAFRDRRRVTPTVEAMIEDATVDAHDDGEQAMGWESAVDAHLDLPFTTKLLSVDVKVDRIELRPPEAIPLLDLPLPPRAGDPKDLYVEELAREPLGRRAQLPS